MADDENNQADIDRSDSVRHASEDARAKAVERMKKAMEAPEGDGSSSSEPERDLEFVEPDQALNKKVLKEVESQHTTLKQVKIYSPFRVYFDGEATSISAENKTGPFDILPGHKNFMSLLTPCEVIVRSKKGEQKLKIDRAVMHVRQDTVKIFLDV